MGRAAPRLKVKPARGRMPVLQFVPPSELAVDTDYQRSVASEDSQALIKRIAQHWNWDLCQPLVVSRRSSRDLFVIDGQHRLEAARLRRDIAQLPCVVIDYDSPAEEAESFVHLNQQRRPLSRTDLFKAAVSSGDKQALAIKAVLDDAGLSLAPHSNPTAWSPMQLGNIGGIDMAWRKHGAAAAGEALYVVAAAFAGEVLQYCGTIYPGIVAVCVDEIDREGRVPATRFAELSAMLGAKGQQALREEILSYALARPGHGQKRSAAEIVRAMWRPDRASEILVPAATSAASAPLNSVPRQVMPEPVATVPANSAPRDTRPPLNFPVSPSGKAWCGQCDRQVSRGVAEACKSRFCGLRVSSGA